jgi:molybdopterin molybdotransferase
MNAARPPLKTLDAALAELLAQAVPIRDVEEVDTFEADGRVLARDLVSELQVPPRDNSSMDGYALRSADVMVLGATLRVGQRIPAGAAADQPLASGEAARIFTGAHLPPGADAVVMQEDCQALEDGQVRINTLPSLGQNVRRAGEDVRLGATVLPRGTRLNSAALGLAASIGLARLPVVRRLRVALFSTGDELVMPGAVAPAQLPPGAIYNSNRFFLRALLQRLGCVVTDCGIVPDQREATITALREAAEGHDLILSSGGVSVGEEDHVKPAVLALGSLDLWQIAMKPGKPFAYGKVRAAQGQAHFIGLPGNPVSSYVTFLLLVRPFLLSLLGMSARALAPVRTTLPAHFEWTPGDKRREFLRVRRNAEGGLDLYPQQSSGVLTSVAWGDGLVDNPPERRIARGDPVQFIAFSEFMV